MERGEEWRGRDGGRRGEGGVAKRRKGRVRERRCSERARQEYDLYN
jgi:hypothetical protein